MIWDPAAKLPLAVNLNTKLVVVPATIVVGVTTIVPDPSPAANVAALHSTVASMTRAAQEARIVDPSGNSERAVAFHGAQGRRENPGKSPRVRRD